MNNVELFRKYNLEIVFIVFWRKLLWLRITLHSPKSLPNNPARQELIIDNKINIEYIFNDRKGGIWTHGIEFISIQRFSKPSR